MDWTDEEWNPAPHGAPRRHFRIVKLLGIGGFGSVYEALLERPDGFRKTVALKILHDEDTPQYVLKRFRDEAKVLGLLRDRAIVSVDVPTKLMDRWSIIMECVDGATASQVLKFIGPIPPRVALSIVGEIARALNKVYGLPGEDGQPIQLIHRDIKAANVSITREGDVKILDFGIARANFTARESSTMQNAGPDGTVGYIAPERFEGVEGPEGDIYSLGITLYVMLTRVRPTHIDRRIDHPEAAMRSALEVAVAMCELDASRRPSALDVHRRCRMLVERMPGPSLAEWAERVVPDAQEAAQRHLSMSEEGDKLGLVGTILTEEPSARPILTAARPTPPSRPPRARAPQSASFDQPSTPGLKVRTAKVAVPTAEVARYSQPPAPRRSAKPSRSRPRVTAQVAAQPERAKPDLARSASPSLPPLPPRAPELVRGTPVSAPQRQQTPRPGLRERTNPGVERTNPLAARADLLRERTNPGVERTNPGVERTSPGFERTSPGFERTSPGHGRTNTGYERTNPGFDGHREWTNPHIDHSPSMAQPRWTTPPSEPPPSRPGRAFAAGLAGVFIMVGAIALLGVAGVWVAENRPEWLEAVGIDPDQLEIPAWMVPGEHGLRPEPPPASRDVAPREAAAVPAPPLARRGPPGPPPTADVAELLPSAGAAVDTSVRFVFHPPGVEMKVDDVLRTRDAPRSTTLVLQTGLRTFDFVLPDGERITRTIDVGGELGATLIEVRDGRLESCRPSEGISRCTQ